MKQNIALNTGCTIAIIICVVSMGIVMIYSTMDICDTMLAIAILFAYTLAVIIEKIKIMEEIDNSLEEMEVNSKES